MTARLPQGWALAELADGCEVIQGQSPPGETYNVNATGLPFFQGKAEFGQLHPVATKWCSAPGKIAEPGDVLISIRAPVGPTNVADVRCCIGRGLAAIRPHGGIEHGYVLHYLRHSASVLAEESTGSTFDAVGGTQLRKHPFVISPLPEQRRIVEAIESYFTRLDDAVATLERVQRNLKRYRASVLKAAVEGQLVSTEAELARAEGRDYEPASVLLERILTERRRRWQQAGGRGKYQDPVAADTTDLPELPLGWCWATVQSLSTNVVDGVHKKPDYVEAGVPFVTVRNLTLGPGISFERVKYVGREDHEQFIRRTHPEQGDILISKDGTLGVIRAIRTPIEFSIFVSVALVKPVDKAMTDYLEIALAAPQVQAQMVPKGSGLQHIHLEDLRQDCVPVPPLIEQKRITAAVQRHLSVADRLEQTMEMDLRRGQRLRQSILKWAFDGRLADQDPSDEPASVLLERIRTETASRVASGSANARAKRRGPQVQ